MCDNIFLNIIASLWQIWITNYIIIHTQLHVNKLHFFKFDCSFNRIIEISGLIFERDLYTIGRSYHQN